MSFILSPFKYHKKKILLFIGMVLICTYIFFPFNDLSDLVSSKVSEYTSGQVYLSFEKMNLSIFPSLGLSFKDVIIETPLLPPLKAKNISASPSIMGLLTFKPGITVNSEGILGGDITLSTRGSGKTQNGNLKQKINLDFENIRLSELLTFMDVPLKISGEGAGHIESTIDLNFGEQPSGEVQISMDKIVMDEGDINIQGMPLNLPRINFSNLDLEAKMEKGSFNISKLSIGKPGQDLYGQISGQISLNLQKQGGNVFVQPGNYNLSVRMQIGEILKQKISSYLVLLQSYQVAQNTYSINFRGMNFYGVPAMTRGN